MTNKKKSVKRKKVSNKKLVKKNSFKKKIPKKNISKKKVVKKKESKIKKILKTIKGKLKKNERVPSGVPGFDKLTQGGFVRNTANILVGTGGSGKTIFAVQSAIDGMKRGEPCLYITFEEKKEQFYGNMKTFGWDLETYEKKGLFNFLQYTPEKVRIMLEEGGGIVESIVINKKISRIVIDSISSFTLLFKDELEKRASVLELFHILRNWDCTSILTLEEDPLAQLSADSKAVQFESDSTVNLYFTRNKKRRNRTMEVVKMRGTDHSQEIFHFDIVKNGIKIGKKIMGDVRKL